MYSDLQIASFRGLRDLELSELARITLLSGKNNTGKSAVLEAFFMLCAGPLAGQAAFTALRAFRGEVSFPLDPSDDATPWDSLFYQFNTSEPVRVSGKRDGERTILELSRAGLQDSVNVAPPAASGTGISFSKQLGVSVTVGNHRNEYMQSMTVSLTPLSTGQPNSPGGQAGNANIQLHVEPSVNGPTDPAFFLGSRLRSNHQELATRYSQLKRRRGGEKDLVNALRLIEPRLQRLEVLVDQGQPALHLDLGSGPLYPLTTLGEGTTSAIDYLLSIYSARDGVVFIDEVENGIHHSVMRDLWQQIHRFAERTNTQVVATTHSQECVEAVHAALAKRPDQLRLIRLRRNAHTDSIESVGYAPDMLDGAVESNLDLR